MPRVFRPIRLFTEEDGKRKPTLFFFIFFFWIFALIAVLGYKYLSARSASRAAAAYLSRTPTPTATATPTSTASPVPSTTPTPSGTLTPTPFVYSDPATWELVEVPSEDGSTSLELQDWQKAEIYQAFEEYYNYSVRSEFGIPDLNKASEFMVSPRLETFQNETYPEYLTRGFYIKYPPLDQLKVKIEYVKESKYYPDEFRIQVTITNPINWEAHDCELNTGEILETHDYGPFKLILRLVFMDKTWKTYLQTYEFLE